MYQSSETTTEQQQAAYIAQHGERLAETVAEVWLEEMPLDEAVKAMLNREMASLIRLRLTTFEQAQMVAKLMGGPSFERWQEEEEEG